MRCPNCGSLDTQVKDSRPAEDDTVIRRRRLCPTCGNRFTTFERVHLRDLTITKKSGRRTPFDREKLARSVAIAFHKRHVTPERLDQLVSGVVRRLESMGESEIPSTVVGEMVMDALAQIDPVAYVRYASIYRDFREVEDFKRILADEKISADGEEDEAS